MDKSDGEFFLNLNGSPEVYLKMVAEYQRLSESVNILKQSKWKRWYPKIKRVRGPDFSFSIHLCG